MPNQNTPITLDNSFASQERAKNWHPTLNGELTPRNISKGSHKKCLFKCDKCLHSYPCSIKNASNGRGCPYCNSSKLCHEINCNICFIKSFASHEKSKFWHPTKNGELTPINITKHNHKKCWFICNTCPHPNLISIAHVSDGRWCPYCSIPTKKMCDNDNCNHCFERSFASHEKSKFWHPTKNGEKTPRKTFKKSNQKFWFKCDTCNNDFDDTLSHVSLGRGCPICKNKTEKKLFEFLKNNYKNVHKHVNYSWCKNIKTDYYLPFDFEIDKKIIIELDGVQHYKEVKYFRENLDFIQNRDMYKMEQAINNGMHVIRILQEDVWNDKNNWKEKLIQEIRVLKDDSDTKIRCIGECDVYREYTIE
jgi:very-short-patch-repair endonuclease